MSKSGLLHLIYATDAIGVPLNTTLIDKKFKLNFLDIGLVHAATMLAIETFFNEDRMTIKRGAGEDACLHSSKIKDLLVSWWITRQRR